MQIGPMFRSGVILVAVTGILGGATAGAQPLPADGHARPGEDREPDIDRTGEQPLQADGHARFAEDHEPDIDRTGEQPLPADGQPRPADGRALQTAGSLRLARTPLDPPGGRMERSVQGDRQPPATYFGKGGLHLALGAASFWQRPTAQPEAATFLSAGLHLNRALAVVGEMGRGWWTSGRLETPARTGPAPACPEIHAGFHTVMGGVQYRLPRARRSTRFVQVLAGRASFAGAARELDGGGAYSNCFDTFSSGLALAVGGGVDFHLTDRLALRVAAAYRHVAIPSLEGTERVFMRDDADRHLGMMRVALGFVLGI